jgi:5-methylcytosine-specific restriction endonuclease McrA
MKGKRHINKVNGTTPILQYACGCGRTYSYRQSLSLHRETCKFKTQSTNITAEHKVQEEQRLIRLEHMVLEERKLHQFEREQYRKEHNEMKSQISILMGKNNSNSAIINELPIQHQTQKSRDKRKTISKEVRQQIVNEQGNKCGKCEQLLSAFFQIDHIVALQFGGTDEKSNLMALCCECHVKKSITENQCRKQIKEAIQAILTVNLINS